MSDALPKKDDATSKNVKLSKEPGQEDERMEDEEKILAGRVDVNYPALLTKDVPGG